MMWKPSSQRPEIKKRYHVRSHCKKDVYEWITPPSDEDFKSNRLLPPTWGWLKWYEDRTYKEICPTCNNFEWLDESAKCPGCDISLRENDNSGWGKVYVPCEDCCKKHRNKENEKIL